MASHQNKIQNLFQGLWGFAWSGSSLSAISSPNSSHTCFLSDPWIFPVFSPYSLPVCYFLCPDCFFLLFSQAKPYSYFNYQFKSFIVRETFPKHQIWISSYCFVLKIYLFERNRACTRAERRYRGRESQADPLLSWEPDEGLNLTTLQSWPERKSRVGG